MIILDSVSKIYDSDLFKKTYTALNKMCFEVKSDAITGFLGANGAGKTTSIKIILDFIRPTSGRVVFDNKLGGNLKNALNHIGYLPERPYFYPHLHGKEFITYLGQLSGMSKDNINKQIEYWAPRLKIDHALNRRLHFYSKGMLQRIGFLASIIHNPKLLILDEPASGLDPIGRRELKNVIKEVASRGTAVFFSSHIVSDVEEICDQLVFIKQGELVYDGPLHDLITKNSLEQYTIKFIENDEVKTCIVETNKLNEVLKNCMDKNLKILRVEPKLLTLEEIVYKS